MSGMDAIYRIIEPMRDLSIMDLEENGFVCVDREAAQTFISKIKKDICEALEDDGK